MKRLKNILLAMEPGTETYKGMYEGSMNFVYPSGEAEMVNEPTYYYDFDSSYHSADLYALGNLNDLADSYDFGDLNDSADSYDFGDLQDSVQCIGFQISRTHKLAQDKPTIVVQIPCRLLRIRAQAVMQATMRPGIQTAIQPAISPEIRSHAQVCIRLENGSLAKENSAVPVLDSLNKIHIADFCLREFKKQIDALNAGLYNRSRPDSENGRYYLPTFAEEPGEGGKSWGGEASLGGEILMRNAAFFAPCLLRNYTYGSGLTVYSLPEEKQRQPEMCLCIRLQVQLPRKKIRKTIQMLCRDLPDAVNRFLAGFDFPGLKRALELAEKQTAIRAWLRNSEYCAFIANGSILPRFKGTDLPMENAVPFQSVPEDEITVCGVQGMGIRRGVTVITGGGYSGKSTLLDAISAGIYDHAPGDGRELCITEESAVTISAEDGRSVKHVNIFPFIRWIPGGDPEDFSTEHASGSTSQAANIMEAVDCGARLLLIDEDRSAANFMIRDRMMKELIEREPITPFTDRAQELHNRQGVSTILVIGGSGEYLSVADRIYMMEDYCIQQVTERAKDICAFYGVINDFPAACGSGGWTQNRVLFADGFSSYPEGSGSERLEISDKGFIQIGDESIDIRGLRDIVSKGQVTALTFMLRNLEVTNKDRRIDLRRKIDELYARIEAEGLDILYSSYFTTTQRFLDLPRRQELLMLINRMRRVRFEKEIPTA